MLKGDVYQRYPDVFLASLKDGFMQWTLKTVSLIYATRHTFSQTFFSSSACVRLWQQILVSSTLN